MAFLPPPPAAGLGWYLPLPALFQPGSCHTALDYATQIKDCTIALYKKCAEYALSKGIIIADTKFEFGLDENGKVVLGDEMLTPDSSRFWPLEGYKPGQGQPSFDKQYVRDWLKANPDNDFLLPEEVVTKTVDKYKEAYELLTGKPFTR